MLYFAFQLSERIHISTPNKYEYQYVKKPARMNQFQVAVKTHNDAHFALSASPHDSAEMLEIVLGGRQNTRSWISLGKMGEPLVSASTPGILSWDEFRSFWISWKGGVVQVRAWRNYRRKHSCTKHRMFKCSAQVQQIWVQIMSGCSDTKRGEWKRLRLWGLCVRRTGATFTSVPSCKVTLYGLMSLRTLCDPWPGARMALSGWHTASRGIRLAPFTKDNN